MKSIMKSMSGNTSSSPTSVTVAEEFSSSHEDSITCFDPTIIIAGTTTTTATTTTSSLAGRGGLPSSKSSSSSQLAASSSLIEDDGRDDEQQQQHHVQTNDDCSPITSSSGTFDLFGGRPDSWSDRKCEKVVKYAHKRLDKLEKSSVSYPNADTLIESMSPTVVHDQIELGRLLGKGAFSSVYSVVSINSDNDENNNSKDKKRNSRRSLHYGNKTSTSTGRPSQLESDKVVVKFLRSKLYNNPAMLAACAGDLCKEGIMLSHLNHSNILKVYATAPNGVDSYINGCHDAFFLVLEKLSETLSDRLSQWMRNKRTTMLTTTTSSSGAGTTTTATNTTRRLNSVMAAIDGSGSFSTSSSIGSALSATSSPSSTTTKKSLPSPFKAAGRRLFSLRCNGGSGGRRSSSSSSSSSVLPNMVNLDERIDVALQLADAVTYLHTQGVLHRDLKPDNIGFDCNGVLKVFDFDVSRRVPASMRDEYNRAGSGLDDSRHSSSGGGGGGSRGPNRKETTLLMTKRVGSPRYMCPEAARGEEYNLKGDVYTYTLLLHELLTLEKPYDDIANEDHDEFVFYRHARPIIPSGLPSELKRLLSCGWSEKIRIRPTMSTMTYDLEEQLPRLLPPQMAARSGSSMSLSMPLSSSPSVSSFKKVPSNHCMTSPMSSSVSTVPLSASTTMTASSRNSNNSSNTTPHQRKSISKSLRDSLLRRNECNIPQLFASS